MRATPSKYYKPCPDACPYHLIIGLDRRPPKLFNNVNEKDIDASLYIYFSDMVELFCCNATILRWLLMEHNVGHVVLKGIYAYKISEVKELFEKYYPSPDIMTLASIEKMGVMDAKLASQLAKMGKLKPAMILAGNRLFSVKDVIELNKDYGRKTARSIETKTRLAVEAEAARRGDRAAKKEAGEEGGGGAS